MLKLKLMIWNFFNNTTKVDAVISKLMFPLKNSMENSQVMNLYNLKSIYSSNKL